MPVKGCCSHRIAKLARKGGGEQAKSKVPSSVSFYLSCHQKAPPTFRVGLPASNTLTKKIPTGVPSSLCFR